MTTSKFLVTFLSLTIFFLQGCLTTQGDAFEQVQNKTILPENFNFTTSDKNLEIPKFLGIPHSLIDVSQVIRKRAEMREGPGINFRLYDRVLPEGTKVIVLRRVGVWQKILISDSGNAGWVHYQTLAKAVKNASEERVASENLPAVFSVRPIKQGFDVNFKPLSLQIPKGRQFLALGWRSKKVLVYLAETNSLLWLAEEEAK